MACTGCYLSHSDDPDASGADPDARACEDGASTGPGRLIRPYPADCIEPSPLSGPIRFCFPSVLPRGTTVHLEVVLDCATCQQFEGSCFVGTSGFEVHVEPGVVTCPESLACRACPDGCQMVTIDCPFRAESAGTYSVRIEGREAVVELRAEPAGEPGPFDCVSL